jgi:hypothetical protein
MFVCTELSWSWWALGRSPRNVSGWDSVLHVFTVLPKSVCFLRKLLNRNRRTIGRVLAVSCAQVRSRSDYHAGAFATTRPVFPSVPFSF